MEQAGFWLLQIVWKNEPLSLSKGILARWVLFVLVRALPSRNGQTLDGAENALAGAAVLSLNRPEKILDFLSLGDAVRGAGAGDNREGKLFL